MEQLLQMAKSACDQAEIYSISYSDDTVFFENAKLNNIDSKVQSGVSLRIIKDGKLGFAYTRNLIDRNEFLRNALDSLEGGVGADYDFPLTQGLPKLDTFDPSVEKVSSSQMVEESFQGGKMLWRQDNDRIYAIYNTGRWESYNDLWYEGDPEYSCGAQQCPPTPRRGFGKIWCTYPAVRQGLGDASNVEWTDYRVVQHFDNGWMMRTGGGDVYAFFYDGGWTR